MISLLSPLSVLLLLVSLCCGVSLNTREQIWVGLGVGWREGGGPSAGREMWESSVVWIELHPRSLGSEPVGMVLQI